MFVLRGCAILRDKQQDDQQPGGGDTPKPGLSDEQKTEIGQIVNAAVTSQLGRALPKALEGLKLGETIAELVKKAMPEPAPPPDPNKTPDNKPDPKVVALEENLKSISEKLKAADERAAAAERKSKEDGARLSLRGALEKHVRPEALDMVSKLLFDAEKRVTFDENGNPLFGIRRAPYAGAAEEDAVVPLADGVAHWLKSDDAKIFVPPPQPGNQGSRGPSQSRGQQRGTGGLPQYDGPATTDEEKLRRASEREAAFRAKYNIND
jgi:hypothetical protein